MCRARLGGALAVGVAVFAVWAPSAQAAFVFDTKWGSFGPGLLQFNTPKGVGGGIAGDVYVADTNNHRVSRFTTTGGFITTWGSSGTATGRFNTPNAVEVDSAGNVWVADTGNNRIQKFDPDGNFLSQLGAAGTGNGQFQNPYGVAVDSAGNIFVADTGNNRIQKFTPAGVYVTQWSAGASPNGTFNSPVDVAVDSPGDVYVTDFGNNRIQKFDNNGTFISRWGVIGTSPGQLWGPYGIDVDSGGSVYVAESANNHRISRFSSTGTFLELTGSQGSGNGQFQTPTGVSTDLFDGLYVADSLNHRVQRFNGAQSAIIVRKDAVPDDPQGFSFTAGGGLTPTSFTLDDDGNTGNQHPNVQTFLVDPGSGYSVTEGATPPGWDAGGVTCSDGSSPSNISVSAQEIVTCTFTNNRRAGIFVVQDSFPNDPQDFDYLAGGGLSPTSFQLDDDGNDSNGLSRSQAFENLPPGSGYSVAQSSTPPDGVRPTSRALMALRLRTSTSLPEREWCARSRTSAQTRGGSSSSRTRSRTIRRTSTSPPAADSAPGRSSSTTTATTATRCPTAVRSSSRLEMATSWARRYRRDGSSIRRRARTAPR